jgi:hypothetical protein
VAADHTMLDWHYRPDLGGITLVTTAPIATSAAATITLR